MATNWGLTDLAAMRLGFPTVPSRFEGRPNLNILIRGLRHLMECAKSHRTPGQPLGKLYLCVLANTYAIYTAQAYPARAPNPGGAPFYG